MGTTSEKLTYLNTTKGKIKDSINLTGANITTEPFRQYSTKLENAYIDIINNGSDTLYNNFPKVSGEGTSLTLNNTYQAPMRNNLKGNTSQTGTPTPTSPIPVNVVSGDNEISVCGKNLLENTFQSQTANGITFTRNRDGSLTFSGTATQARSITGRFTKELTLKKGVTYTFSLGNKQAGYGVYLQKTGNVNVWYLGISATNSSMTITPTEDTTIQQLAIHFPNGNTVNGTIYPMLEVGSSASTYEPYQGNTYNIDLPSGIELCKIGNYQDYFYKDSGKWYLHKEIGKITFNGSENWGRSGNTSESFFCGVLAGSGVPFKAKMSTAIDSKCDYFIKGNSHSNAEVFDMYNGTDYYTAFALYLSTNKVTDITAFKSWLVSHNITLYYVLYQPTTEVVEYQPLIDQLNELEKAISYENQTNISQVNNDLGFIINASALKKG